MKEISDCAYYQKQFKKVTFFYILISIAVTFIFPKSFAQEILINKSEEITINPGASTWYPVFVPSDTVDPKLVVSYQVANSKTIKVDVLKEESCPTPSRASNCVYIYSVESNHGNFDVSLEPGKTHYLLFHNSAFLFGTKTVNVNVQVQSEDAPSFIIETDSMAPALHIGDIIVLDNNTNFDSIKVGDIIVFRAVDPAEENKTHVHRVVNIFQPGKRMVGNSIFNRLCDKMSLPVTPPIKTIMTKGDANDCSIPLVAFPITQKNYVVKVAYTIHSSNQSNQSNKDNKSYKYVRQWGSQGSGNGQFDKPSDIAIDSHNNVYVADSQNGRIQKFNSSDNFITQWNAADAGVPHSIAIDSHNNVYTTDSGNEQVQKFDSNGNFIMAWGPKGTDIGQLLMPAGLTVEPHGNVYIIDLENDKVQAFAPVD